MSRHQFGRRLGRLEAIVGRRASTWPRDLAALLAGAVRSCALALGFPVDRADGTPRDTAELWAETAPAQQAALLSVTQPLAPLPEDA
jgi:hypothetical protein